MRYRLLTFLLIGCICSLSVKGQIGMLSKGNWVKIAVPDEGVFQVTGAQIKAMGFSGPISSNQVQLFGMDLSRLSEKVPIGLPDSLTEIAIEMQDGGDGALDDQDRFLFYAQGKNTWVKTGQFDYPIRQKIAANDSLYFFLTMGSKGKRINQFLTEQLAPKVVSEYAAKWLIEKDSINVLSSGKIWLGEPMGTGVGKKSTITFPINLEGVQFNAPVFIQSQLAATTYQTEATFSIKLNDVPLINQVIGAVSGFLFDDAYKLNVDTNSVWLERDKLLKANQTLATVNVQVDFKADATSTGWVDYIALHAQRKIGFWNTSSFGFDYTARNPADQVVAFEIQNASSQTRVWEVSKFFTPVAFPVVLGQDVTGTFSTSDSSQKQFYVFESNKINSAQFSSKVVIDSSFTTAPVDYIMISAPDYYAAALKLKAFHEKQNGLKVLLVRSTQVFNEMSSGQTTPIAIRNFIKYIVERAQKNNQVKPSYLLLFGMGNFNANKLIVNQELPVYTSEASNATLTSYSTDDFYAILKSGDQIQYAQTIDSILLAVGRIPARTIAESEMMVKKLINYQTSKKMGIWQQQLTWVADDADYNLHLQDAEEIISNLEKKSTNWNHRKLYLDLFKANQTLTGVTYPDVNKSIQESIQAGTLVLNYTGHGNYLRLSEEAVITKTEMQAWDNLGRLPIMVTASCDFAPYDQPTIAPIGFDALMQNEKGIISLVAANRLVFAYSNKQINDAFMQALLLPDDKGVYPSIGKALQAAKKYNFSKNGDRLNAFKFGLMGDPAMQIAQPKLQIQGIAINQLPWTDSIHFKAGGKYTIQGNVSNQTQINKQFNGFVEMILWDAPSSKRTLANQSTSQQVAVETQEQAIFKGKASVQNGVFEISFIVPATMPISNESALKLQLYAYNDSLDASKQYQQVYIKASELQLKIDTLGPSIKSYVNSPNFKSGDWVTMPATLVVELTDSSGIQSAGNVLGHDLKLIIDDTIVVGYNLNNFFSYELNQYQSGKIQYPLPSLSVGRHRLIIRAWDLLGNLSKDTIYIEVPSLTTGNLRNLTVLPNPVKSASRFAFELNNSKDPIALRLEVYDLSGKIYYSVLQQMQPTANKIVVNWNGRTNQGGQLASGIYYYRIVVAQNGQQEQLVNTLLKF